MGLDPRWFYIIVIFGPVFGLSLSHITRFGSSMIFQKSHTILTSLLSCNNIISIGEKGNLDFKVTLMDSLIRSIQGVLTSTFCS